MEKTSQNKYITQPMIEQLEKEINVVIQSQENYNVMANCVWKPECKLVTYPDGTTAIECKLVHCEF